MQKPTYETITITTACVHRSASYLLFHVRDTALTIISGTVYELRHHIQILTKCIRLTNILVQRMFTMYIKGITTPSPSSLCYLCYAMLCRVLCTQTRRPQPTLLIN